MRNENRTQIRVDFQKKFSAVYFEPNQRQPRAVAIHPYRQGFCQSAEGPVGVVEREHTLDAQVANLGSHAHKTATVRAQGVDHLLKGFVQHIQPPARASRRDGADRR